MSLSRRDFLRNSGAAMAAISAMGASARSAAAPDTRPNILWIYIEDMNPLLSSYGETLIDTPHMDALAKDGVLFENTFVPCPVCSATNALDGNPGSHWHTRFNPDAPKHPHWIALDLGRVETVVGLRALPRQQGELNGAIKEYEIHVSRDSQAWEKVAAGQWSYGEQRLERKAEFDPVQARRVRLTALSEIKGGVWASVAKLNAITE